MNCLLILVALTASASEQLKAPEPFAWNLISNSYSKTWQPWTYLWDYPNWSFEDKTVSHDCDEPFYHACVGDNPNPGPPWSTPFASLYSGTWHWQVGVGGTVLALTKRTWEYRYEREQGAESWRDGESGPSASRVLSVNQINFEVRHEDQDLYAPPGGGN